MRSCRSLPSFPFPWVVPMEMKEGRKEGDSRQILIVAVRVRPSVRPSSALPSFRRDKCCPGLTPTRAICKCRRDKKQAELSGFSFIHSFIEKERMTRMTRSAQRPLLPSRVLSGVEAGEPNIIHNSDGDAEYRNARWGTGMRKIPSLGPKWTLLLLLLLRGENLRVAWGCERASVRGVK